MRKMRYKLKYRFLIKIAGLFRNGIRARFTIWLRSALDISSIVNLSLNLCKRLVDNHSEQQVRPDRKTGSIVNLEKKGRLKNYF